jgi:hypothetical protein
MQHIMVRMATVTSRRLASPLMRFVTILKGPSGNARFIRLRAIVHASCGCILALFVCVKILYSRVKEHNDPANKFKELNDPTPQNATPEKSVGAMTFYLWPSLIPRVLTLECTKLYTLQVCFIILILLL